MHSRITLSRTPVGLAVAPVSMRVVWLDTLWVEEEVDAASAQQVRQKG